MANSVELKRERFNLWTQMTALNERAETENRALSAEEREQWDRMDAAIETYDQRIADQEKLEHAPANPGPGPVDPPNGEHRVDPASAEARKEAESKAFRTWLKYGGAVLSEEQRAIMARLQGEAGELPIEARALGVGLDTAGGYLVPEGFRAQIEQAMLFYGGMRDPGVCTIFQTDSGNDLPIPTGNDTSNVGELLGENTTVNQQDVAVGQVVLRAYMFDSKMIKVPYTLLQDSAFDIESWLSGQLAERIGRIQNTYFTVGSGANGPTGVAVDVTSGVTAASSTAVAWDELIGLEHSVDRAYRPRGRYMLHDNTLRDLRKQKDGEGRYLWQPGAPAAGAGAIPNTINQFPYTVNNDVPTMATGAKAILFGDFSKYLIRDVRGFTLLTLRERFADTLQVAFLAFARADGKLVDAGTRPIKCITMA